MQTFLLAIGAIAAAVGVFAIGFGAEIYDFSFGNTLIIVGTVSLIGGAVIVGLALAIRELTRIADAASARLPSRNAPRTETTDGDTSGGVGRRGQSNRPGYVTKSSSEAAGKDPRPVEPRLSAVPPPEEFDEPAVVRPRQNIYPLVRPHVEPRVVENLDNIALSPHAPSRATKAGRAETARAEKTSHRTGSDQTESVANTSQLGANDAMVAAQMTSVQSATLEALRPVPVTPRQQASRANLFDSLWPASAKPRAQFANEAVARDLDSRPTAVATQENVDSVLALPKREETHQPRSQNEPRSVSILKSGVIDGMAYTLYTDGSIEAQLSQTTIRFNSIEELRDHLENGV